MSTEIDRTTEPGQLAGFQVIVIPAPSSLAAIRARLTALRIDRAFIESLQAELEALPGVDHREAA